MKRLELFVEQIILASRWLLVVFYLGLAVALGVYAVTFGRKLMSFEFLSNACPWMMQMQSCPCCR